MDEWLKREDNLALCPSSYNTSAALPSHLGLCPCIKQTASHHTLPPMPIAVFQLLEEHTKELGIVWRKKNVGLFSNSTRWNHCYSDTMQAKKSTPIGCQLHPLLVPNLHLIIERHSKGSFW